MVNKLRNMRGNKHNNPWDKQQQDTIKVFIYQLMHNRVALK